MARVKRGIIAHRKHKKVLSLTKGHKLGRSKLIKQAKESLLHAGQYAFAGRKQRKREMRRLWITQLNAALKAQGIRYSDFIHQLQQKQIKLDRKILADLAIHDQKTFQEVVSQISSS